MKGEVSVKKTYHWGIMGPGFIADKVLPDFSLSDGGRVLAAASNTPGKAETFTKKWGIERAYEKYEALVEDPDIDIIYITTPNAFHHKNAILAMEHGKHVLCEKPFAVNAKAAEEMIACAKENHVFLMEAMWTRFIPAVKELKQQITAGRIGKIHQIISDFSYDVPFDPKYHLYDPQIGGGTLLDGGIYPLSFAGYLYENLPEEYFGYANLRNGVDIRDHVILKFPSGGMSSFICGADTASPWNSVIYGSKGTIKVPAFYAAKEFQICEYKTKKEEWQRFPYEGLGYQFEINEVMKCVEEGREQSKIMPLEESLGYMHIMDELRKEWGVVYPQDKEEV